MKHLAAVAVVLGMLSPALGGMTPGKHHGRRWSRQDVTVIPSEAIEARVSSEIDHGQDVLGHLAPANLFASSYVVSAIVYHDGFLRDFPKDETTADPSRRIVAHLKTLVTPVVKGQYIDLLRKQYGTFGASDKDLVRPVAGFIDVQHLRRNHHDAIDVFAPEGSPVHAARGGVVVLADRGWDPADPFAVASLRGGNSVVVFDPGANRFYRYCHLGKVEVEPGQVVHAGWTIGTVGHTGANAERDGHGQHLHFEVNQYDGRDVYALDYRQLLALLRTASPAPNEDGQAAGTMMAGVLPVM